MSCRFSKWVLFTRYGTIRFYVYKIPLSKKICTKTYFHITRTGVTRTNFFFFFVIHQKRVLITTYSLMCLFKIKKDINFVLNRLNSRYIVLKYCPKKKNYVLCSNIFQNYSSILDYFFPILWLVQKPSDNRKPNRNQHILVWLNILYRPMRRCGV